MRKRNRNEFNAEHAKIAEKNQIKKQKISATSAPQRLGFFHFNNRCHLSSLSLFKQNYIKSWILKQLIPPDSIIPGKVIQTPDASSGAPGVFDHVVSYDEIPSSYLSKNLSLNVGFSPANFIKISRGTSSNSGPNLFRMLSTRLMSLDSRTWKTRK